MKKERKAGKKPARKKNKEQESEMFNFDKEIVIGVTKLPEPKQEKNKNKKKNKKSKETKGQATRKNKKHTNVNKKAKPNKKIDLKKEKRKRRMKSFIKGMAITTILIGLTLALLLSPMFKLSKIEVNGNTKISNNEIIILSEIEEGDNIFLINNNSVINKIKQNPYIESVKVEKQLPDKIVLQIEERQATYALKYGEEYVYINNQGYILEIAESPNNLPQILSYKTSQEDIKVGNRLSDEDLELLEIVLKIMKVANSNGIGNLITSIDIANKNDIILRLESERKNSISR